MRAPAKNLDTDAALSIRTRLTAQSLFLYIRTLTWTNLSVLPGLEYWLNILGPDHGIRITRFIKNPRERVDDRLSKKSLS